MGHRCVDITNISSQQYDPTQQKLKALILEWHSRVRKKYVKSRLRRGTLPLISTRQRGLKKGFSRSAAKLSGDLKLAHSHPSHGRGHRFYPCTAHHADQRHPPLAPLAQRQAIWIFLVDEIRRDVFLRAALSYRNSCPTRTQRRSRRRVRRATKKNFADTIKNGVCTWQRKRQIVSQRRRSWLRPNAM